MLSWTDAHRSGRNVLLVLLAVSFLSLAIVSLVRLPGAEHLTIAVSLSIGALAAQHFMLTSWFLSGDALDIPAFGETDHQAAQRRAKIYRFAAFAFEILSILFATAGASKLFKGMAEIAAALP